MRSRHLLVCIESAGNENDTETDADVVARTLTNTILELGYGFTDITGGGVTVAVRNVNISKPLIAGGEQSPPPRRRIVQIGKRTF